MKKRQIIDDKKGLKMVISLVEGESPNLTAAVKYFLAAVEKMETNNLDYLSTYRFFSTDYAIFQSEVSSFIQQCVSRDQARFSLD